MQLSLSSFIVIVSLLVSVILSEYREEYTKEKAAIEDPIGRIRNGRTTYVKAILSNPKLSPSQQLAQKLARAELDSPKMQETFKKLTAVHSSRQNSHGISNFARSPEDVENSHKPPRFKGPRKRKRKRHKSRRCNFARGIHSRKRKANDHHPRLTRQTKNASSKMQGKGRKNRYGKSVQYYPNDMSNVLDNNQNFDADPSANLDLESFDTNQQSSGIDDNSLNYLPNYSPLTDQNDYLGNGYVEDNQDVLTSNSQSQNQFRYENPYEISNNRYSISDGSSPQHFSSPLRYQNNENVMPNRFNQRKNFRTYGNLMSDQFSNGAPLQPNYRSGSMYPTKTQRLAGKSEIPSPQMSFNTNQVNNSVTSIENTIKGGSMIGRGEYMKQQARRAPKIEKMEESMEKSVSGANESCTTTEMNPKLKGIGEASAVPSEIVEKAVAESKSLKGTEYHLLPIKANEPQAAIGKTLQSQQINSTSVANETKEVAGQILNKIIEELEDLKLDRTKNDQKEGLPCRLSGSWITTMAGVRIDMFVTNRTVNVSMAKLDLPVGIARQGILNYTWNITGYAPFKRGGPFSLTATDNHMKSLAVFVGACRVCQGIDTIEGVWSIAREPRDCRDFQVATSIYNDIFRRTKLLSAIKERQLGLISTTKCTSTTTVPTTKEDNLSAALGVDKSA